jgi:peroxiredoxin
MTKLDHEASAEPETAPVSVQGNLDALLAERVATWSPERVAEHAALRRSIESRADPTRFVKVGDHVATFNLAEVDGGRVVLDELLATGPVVLIFFRFESCPACNVALPAYRDVLAPALSSLGVSLVAVSPQAADRLRPIKHRLGLDFLVASDPDANLLHAFGIAFGPSADEQERQRAAGSDLGEVLGTGRWELPYPTVVVIGRGGIVTFADVRPDWMARTEAATVIDAVRTIT